MDEKLEPEHTRAMSVFETLIGRLSAQHPYLVHKHPTRPRPRGPSSPLGWVIAAI